MHGNSIILWIWCSVYYTSIYSKQSTRSNAYEKEIVMVRWLGACGSAWLEKNFDDSKLTIDSVRLQHVNSWCMALELLLRFHQDKTCFQRINFLVDALANLGHGLSLSYAESWTSFTYSACFLFWPHWVCVSENFRVVMSIFCGKKRNLGNDQPEIKIIISAWAALPWSSFFWSK